MVVLNNNSGELKEISTVDTELKDAAMYFMKYYNEITSNSEMYGGQLLSVLMYVIKSVDTDESEIQFLFTTDGAIQKESDIESLVLDVKQGCTMEFTADLFSLIKETLSGTVPVALSVTQY